MDEAEADPYTPPPVVQMPPSPLPHGPWPNPVTPDSTSSLNHPIDSEKVRGDTKLRPLLFCG